MVRAWMLAAAVSLVAAIVGCQSGSPRGEGRRQARELDELARCMIGSFSSAEQHAADGDNYLDIRLEMVRIWPQRTDGYWLYVEQAAATALDEPYRQRVYHVFARPEGTFESAVFTLADATKAVGAWKMDDPLSALSPADLTRRDGCAMVLQRQSDGSFAGGTEGMGCASDLRGAAYATSEATISADRIITWDRGFDAGGIQVWGSTKGGYIFVKESDSR